MNGLIHDHIEKAIGQAGIYHTKTKHDFDELKSCALLGLVEAAHRYEDQGHKFWSFAYVSVNMAMKGYVRKMFGAKEGAVKNRKKGWLDKRVPEGNLNGYVDTVRGVVFTYDRAIKEI